ncbi:SDR family oxidoreductase [Cohnella fermenti]|uniref:SDR family oxidoreductase n=2 Tax=Cohnella fermenti TaxID=2565925 RepID=A0A4S4C4T9_9BACL|nr:SDR family oxidoreductase [Cohnella fermenti]
MQGQEQGLRGRIALVTGGSRGLGQAISAALAEQGAHVLVNYARNEAQAQAVVDRIASRGGLATALRADVTDEAEVAGLAERIERQLGRPADILVNNATGPQPMLPLEDSEWQDYMDQLVFFVKAPLLLVKALLPHWKSQRYGRIVNIGSEVVQLGNANFSSYVAAKSAMIGMTRSWANELGRSGVTANLVAPGWIPVERHAGTSSEELDAYAAGVPLGHMGESADIGAAVAFLASDAAKFVTGQCLAVNGGKTFGI